MAAQVSEVPAAPWVKAASGLPRAPAKMSTSPQLGEVAAASCAMAMTSLGFNPFDTVKTKMQTQNQLSADATKRLYNGVTHCVQRVRVEDGFVRGLWLPGLAASVGRDVINGAVRMGCYPATVRALHEHLPWAGTGGPPALSTRILAGLVTGFTGAFLANPLDVVKVRLQAEAGTVERGVYVTGLKRGSAPSPNTLSCIWRLAAEEGVLQGLLRGVGANCGRAALVTSSQMCAYEETKQLLQGCTVWPFDNQGPRIAFASFMSGVSAATLAAPVDLVRSRVMDDSGTSKHAAAYKGALDCAWRTVRAEGPFALWKGWSAAYLRLGPHFMVSMPLLELFRTQVFGLRGL